MDRKLFEKHYSHLRRESILKALLCGLIAGFAVNFVTALTFYLVRVFSGRESLLTLGLWLSIGSGVVIGVLTAIILYYKVFKPNTQKIARRLDNLGLEERLVTMLDFENDPSYMAKKQREDAKQRLSQLDVKSVKFHIAKSAIVAAAVLAVFGLSITTVSALTEFNIIEAADPPVINNTENYQDVTYLVEGEGYIEGVDGPVEGIDAQLVLLGEDAETVVAVPEDGWVFVAWSDDYAYPERTDKNITGALTVTAIFMELDDPGFQEGPGADGEPVEGEDGNGDEPDNKPDDGNNNESGNDDPSKGDDGEEGEAGQGQDRYAESNQFKDGKTPYQDEFFSWQEKAMQELLDNPNLTPEQRAMIEAFFNYLGTGVGNTNSQDANE